MAVLERHNRVRFEDDARILKLLALPFSRPRDRTAFLPVRLHVGAEHVLLDGGRSDQGHPYLVPCALIMIDALAIRSFMVRRNPARQRSAISPALDPRIGEPIPAIEVTVGATTSHDEPPRHNGRHSTVAMYGHRLVVRCHHGVRSRDHRVSAPYPVHHLVVFCVDKPISQETIKTTRSRFTNALAQASSSCSKARASASCTFTARNAASSSRS